MRPSPVTAALALLLAASACRQDPPHERGPEPMRAPPHDPPSPQLPPSEPSAGPQTEGLEQAKPTPVVLRERPRADPDIDRALDLIGGSGLRFFDTPSDPNARPIEYTAEQFASMLRSKWDWIGYDLVELEPWLDAIATRSFKTRLPYRVELAGGTLGELRPWLDERLQERGSE